MTPPVFTLATANAAVTALLGTNPTRLWPFDDAPQKGKPGYGLPYAVWQLVGGVPENYLDRVPDADSYSVQIDVYAKNSGEARDVTLALRDCYEPHAYIQNWNGESREAVTRLYRVSFDIDFIVLR